MYRYPSGKDRSCTQHAFYIYFIRALGPSRNPPVCFLGIFLIILFTFFFGGGVGQIIKDIDSKSPAEKAGLKNNDLVVAVNGKSVESLDHDSVVEMIRKGGDQTSLLVVDKETDNIYKLVSNTRSHNHDKVGSIHSCPQLWLSYHFDLHTGRGITIIIKAALKLKLVDKRM